jgi:hypothetical protein
VYRFADALRLASVGDAKVADYVQFAYEIIKVNDNDIRVWSRDDVDSMALLT